MKSDITPLPTACITELHTMLAPANSHDILITLNADIPMLSTRVCISGVTFFKEKLLSIKSMSEDGSICIIKNPIAIIAVAYINDKSVVFFILSCSFAPKLYAIIGTIPLLSPNTGINTILISLK